MLRLLLAIVAISATAAPGFAQPGPPAIAYTGPASGAVATAVRDQLQGFAGRRGMSFADLATPAVARSRARELLAAGIEAYHALRYANALASLESALAEVESRGGAELNRRELADLFLYRALSATETGATEVARDNLVRAATVYPSYPIDEARFRPSLVASYERARDAVRAAAAAEVELALPEGCRVWLDGGDASGVKLHSLRPGRHFIRARCPNKKPLVASPTFAAGKQRFAPTLEPAVDHRARALAATAPTPRVLWADLAGAEVSVALIDRASDKILRRWTVRVDTPAAAKKLDGVMTSIVEREFAAPVPDPVIVEKQAPRAWYEKPWLWVAVGVVGASAVAVPILILRSGDPTSFDAATDFGGRR